MLETDTLMFRGGTLRMSIPYADISGIEVTDGILCVTHTGGTARFQLGSAAAKWAEKIRNPPTRAQKLGLKARQRVLIVGVDDRTLHHDLTISGATVLARAAASLDVVFFGAERREALGGLAALRRSLAPHGAVWVIRPKGGAAISESDVMQAGKAAGLVDVKVVRFSATHTAEKFVIPVKDRIDP